MSILSDSDAYGAAVTMAAQRIAAFAEQQKIRMLPEQCEELAEIVVRFAEGFVAGISYANELTAPSAPPSSTASDHL